MMYGLENKLIHYFFFKTKAGIISIFNLDIINTSVIMLLYIHFSINVYGQDASTERTFLYSKTFQSFLFQTILLFHWLYHG